MAQGTVGEWLASQTAKTEMKTYTAEIVSEYLIIQANSEEEAERKYEAYWLSLPCPDHPELLASRCSCIEYNDGGVSHTITEN